MGCLSLSAVRTFLPRATSSFLWFHSLCPHMHQIPVLLSSSGYLRCAQHAAVHAQHHQPIEKDRGVEAASEVEKEANTGARQSECASQLHPFFTSRVV